MIRLQPHEYGPALALHRDAGARFPLIGAVLLDRQDGLVFADDRAAPRQAYVEHAFGFAQVLGTPAPAFDSALERYLLVERRFAAPKARLYTPRLPAFLARPECYPLRSWRQRFVIGPEAVVQAPGGPLPEVDVVEVTAANIEAMAQVFDVVRRFWRSAAEFASGAGAVMVMHRGEPASVCYAAAEADGKAEIDVLTRPQHQKMGLGKIAVTHFVRRCFARGVAPLWDCFTNNDASMNLSRAIGFLPLGQPYPFFTINK